jgi:hypothetical protein
VVGVIGGPKSLPCSRGFPSTFAPHLVGRFCPPAVHIDRLPQQPRQWIEASAQVPKHLLGHAGADAARVNQFTVNPVIAQQ